ncbi:hypothetical protein Taro_034583 [Colocasia esculenta]|uniref:Uncharacterized protein n=1 Tax=Colocasia esculenta TaxID=4460 RepID=A0A843W4E2_COLES|nr:hypothetical protein [Colocasia esculenta]
MESTKQVSPGKANADPGTTDARALTHCSHGRKHPHGAVEEDGSGGHYTTPPELSAEADGEILTVMMGHGPSCAYTRERDVGDILRARQPEGVVCLPLFLRQFSDACPSTRTRLYQVWPGRNVFFLRGHIICGPDPRGFLLTALSILLSTWIFCFYVASDSPEASPLTITTALILALIVRYPYIPISKRSSLSES